MKVLVACEFSGTVRDAFAEKGHDAWSNDLLPAEGNHLQMDVLRAFGQQDWDIIIMHPPCTALCVSGNRWYAEGKPKYDERTKAICWTMRLWNLAIKTGARVCMENPVGCLPVSPTQYIQPWQFGHGETKATGLWLWWLPPLQPSNIVEGRSDRIHKMPPGPDRWKERSKTYPGIAKAMAETWG